MKTTTTTTTTKSSTSTQRIRAARAVAAGALLLTAVTAGAGAADAAPGHPGAVYTISNDPGGNEVLVFDRNSDGTIERSGSYATGGTGSGGGLGSQGAVVLTDNGRLLLAVNPGSDEVSVFAVESQGGLRLLDTVPTGGDLPTSVTIHGDIVYVLNAADAEITGFELSSNGLEPLAGSTRPLSQAASGPAQVEFTPRGDQLVVTQRATNVIDVFAVDGDGYAGPATPNASDGATPFGFAFDNRGRLFVSNASGGAAGASSLSSYVVRRDESLDLIDGQVPTTQTAACWVVITPNGRFAFTTNTASGTISAFAIDPDGTMTLLDAVAGSTGAGPIDAALSRNGRFLYTVNAGADSISVFAVDADGGLTPLDTITGLPAAVAGLAAA